QKLPA
ncbi:Glycerol-3-phosphate dehydrogenase [NAD(P)+], partial [Haemophilus influenzae]